MAQYPTSVGFKNMSVEDVQPIERIVADDGSVQVRVLGVHRTAITVNHPPMSREEFAPIDAFIESLKGEVNSCTLSLPDKATPQGAATGTAYVNGARLAGDTVIPIDGLAAGVTAALVASDIITFANHTKVYKIVSTVDTGAAAAITDESGATITDESGSPIYPESSGQVMATISPPLIKNVPDNTVVTYSGVVYTVKLAGAVQSYKVSPNIYEKQVKFIERIS